MSKKVKISFLIMIWGIVGLQSYLNWLQQNQNRVVEAFSPQKERNVSVEGKERNVCVKGYAYLGTLPVSLSQKESLLKKIAKELKVETDNRIVKSQKDHYEEWSLQTAEPDTVLQVISLYDFANGSTQAQENYLFIELSPEKDWEQGKKYYSQIKELFDEMGVNGNVNIEKELEKPGDLQTNRRKREALVKEIFEQENAVMADEMDAAGFFTAYGYKDGEAYITNLNGKNVNVQIVMDYSKEDKKTYIKVGCPIVNTIY